jgi:hypothetical protein
MSLTAAFNDDYPAEMANSYVLVVQYDVAGYNQVMAYDFKARVMTLRTDDYAEAGVRILPFSQLDRDSLVEMREQLIELGGNPPPLPAEPNTLNKPARGLNP